MLHNTVKQPIFMLQKTITTNLYVTQHYKTTNIYVTLHYKTTIFMLQNTIKQVMTHCVNAVKHKFQCKIGYFDLYGYDFMIDEDMKVCSHLKSCHFNWWCRDAS